jgi:hypothetical protein
MMLRRDCRSAAGGASAELNRKGACQKRGQKLKNDLTTEIIITDLMFRLKKNSGGYEHQRGVLCNTNPKNI